MIRRRSFLETVRDQTGVAMVTVLFVGAALTVMSSAAAYMTIQEMRASVDDRKASEALAIAEAGLDRMISYLRSGNVTWGHIRNAGCGSNAPLTFPGGVGAVGNGTYDAQLTVYNPFAVNPGDRLPPAACAGRSPNPRAVQYFLISSTGRHPAAKRVVRQVLKISSINLPIGIYADRASLNGSPNMFQISLITSGDVFGREKMGFTGLDPYYTLNDFWPGMGTAPAPAGVHSLGTIWLKSGGAGNRSEHPANPNCTANNRGTNGQSMWDQSGRGNTNSSGCANWGGSPSGPPPTSKFTSADLDRVTPKPGLSDQDYLALRESAKASGLYCLFKADGTQACMRQGQPWAFGGTVQQPDVDPVLAASPNFVAYFEYENPTGALTSNLVHWKADVWACNDDPVLNRSVIMIVRQGSMKIEGTSDVNGAILVPEGLVTDSGSFTINGTIIAKEFGNLGNGTFQVNSCWINNMPGPFLDVAATKWSEVDR